MAPGEYGKDFKSFCFVLPPGEHKALKLKAAEFGVSAATVCRMALADDAMWRKAFKAAQARKAGE